MKSTVYALDANTISYLLRGEGAVDSHFEQELIKADNLYVVPYIVVYEVRRWLRDRPTRQSKFLPKSLMLYFKR
jgi:predicted nucleic acid-binding protein